MHRVDGGDAETRRQHAVERGRRAAALHVPEHDGARLVARARLDLAGQRVTDAAEARVAERIDLAAARAR